MQLSCLETGLRSREDPTSKEAKKTARWDDTFTDGSKMGQASYDIINWLIQAIKRRGVKYVVTLDAYGDYQCDGTEDDIQIQEAVDAAYAAGGGKVALMDGTFSVKTSVEPKNKVQVQGQGVSTVLKLASAANTSVIALPAANTANQWSFSDLAIDGNKTAQAAGTMHGIGLGGTCSQWLLNNLYIHDVQDYGVGLYTNCGQGSINNVYASACGGSGIDLNNVNNVTISNVEGHSNGSCAVYVRYGSYININHVRASGNTSMGISVGDNTPGHDSYYVNVDDLVSWSNGAEAINYTYVQHGNMSNINSYGDDDYGICLNRSLFISLNNFTVKESKNSGLACSSGGVQTCDHNTISNGTIYNCNTADSAGNAGINVASTYSSFKNIVIVDDRGTKKHRYGFEEESDANYNTVKGLVIKGYLTGPILCRSANSVWDRTARTVSSLDLCGAATDIEVWHAKVPSALVGYNVFYTEASSGEAGVNIRVGRYQDGVGLDDDYFDITVSESNKNKGFSRYYVTSTLTNSAVAAGDTITAGTAGGKAGTGQVMLVLDIAEMTTT